MTLNIISGISQQELDQIVQMSSCYADVFRALGIDTKRCGQAAYARLKELIALYSISTKHFTHLQAGYVVRTPDNIFCQQSTVDPNTLSNAYKKIDDIPYACSVCGNTGTWNGQSLTVFKFLWRKLGISMPSKPLD